MLAVTAVRARLRLATAMAVDVTPGGQYRITRSVRHRRPCQPNGTAAHSGGYARTESRRVNARTPRRTAALCAAVEKFQMPFAPRLARVDGGCVARLRQTGDVIDLDSPLFFVDRVEDAVPAGPQPPQVRRPVSERLRWPRLVGEQANALPERSDTGG